MGLFDIFKKKEKLTIEEQQWNKMWDLWTEEEIKSPYKELMTYQSEINNGGHSQYFDNTENISNVEDEIKELKKILPKELYKNLDTAYNAYLKLIDSNDELSEEVLDKCDNLFYEKEELINEILKDYSKNIKI